MDFYDTFNKIDRAIGGSGNANVRDTFGIRNQSTGPMQQTPEVKAAYDKMFDEVAKEAKARQQAGAAKGYGR